MEISTARITLLIKGRSTSDQQKVQIKMNHLLAPLSLLAYFLNPSIQCSNSESEFKLKGDYLIGGLFDIHHATRFYPDRPEAIDCSR